MDPFCAAHRYHGFCPPPSIIIGCRGGGGGGLTPKFAKNLWEQKFLLYFWEDKPLWEELKIYVRGSNIY